MQYAIIAAGEGSRLAQEGIQVRKPFVRVHGETLLDRLVRIFRDNGAEDVVVAVREDADGSTAEGNCRTIRCSTPSSMHTFYELKPFLRKDEPFVLTTVDTVFREDEFREYVRAFRKAVAEGYDGLMGVTDYVDDEKPLYVKVDRDESDCCNENGLSSDITDFCDTPCSPFVSAGVYGLTPAALETLERCMERGESRMRNFQRALIREGKRLKAWCFSKVIDIDHAGDIAKAEEMLATNIFFLRAEEFSPGRVDDDRAIMMAVKERVGEGLVIREEELSALTNKKTKIKTVFSMARRPESLEVLKQWEKAGATVINAPAGVERCRRSAWDELMRKHGMPVPPAEGRYGYWLKRGDSAVTAGGIAYCKDAEELTEAKTRFAGRGVTDVVVQAHVRGDVVKFYGVKGLFFWDSRSNLNTPNTLNTPNGCLREAAERMAQIVGIQVYGGDAVITADHDFYIIDFNDWPSFSRCKDEAAAAISKLATAGMGNEKNVKM